MDHRHKLRTSLLGVRWNELWPVGRWSWLSAQAFKSSGAPFRDPTANLVEGSVSSM
ncbi:MAG: hypothetical protein M0013_08005 [Actinomycetota bacterium]|nr:hypothetical protein [Actinomycetota bacterium]